MPAQISPRPCESEYLETPSCLQLRHCIEGHRKPGLLTMERYRSVPEIRRKQNQPAWLGTHYVLGVQWRLGGDAGLAECKASILRGGLRHAIGQVHVERRRNPTA